MNNYALMLFETEFKLGVSGNPNKWVNTANYYFDNGTDALNAYANTPCPASQLVEGKDPYELKCRMGQMLLNYQDEDWLNENLYPFL